MSTKLIGIKYVLLAYCLILTVVSINALRQLRFQGGFDRANLSQYQYRIVESNIDEIFFKHHTELKNLKRDFPSLQLSIQAAFIQEETVYNYVKKVNNSGYPFLTMTVNEKEVSKFIQKIKKINLAFNHIVIAK